MKPTLLAALAFLAAGLQAQQAVSPSQRVVAVINGETITKEKLDALYANIGAPMRAQYEQSGGKAAFLDNYIAKRLIVQQALNANFDKRPDVQAAVEAARESAIFDRYVREVVAANAVTEAAMRKYYDDHRQNFLNPEAVKMRHIVVTFAGKEKEQALDRMRQIAADLHPYRVASPAAMLNRFAEAARMYSEDGSAPSGGDLGWVVRGKLVPKVEQAAFNMKPGSMSGILETEYGYHLLFVEEKQEASMMPFEEQKRDIREVFLGERAKDVLASVKKTADALRQKGSVTVFPENID